MLCHPHAIATRILNGTSAVAGSGIACGSGGRRSPLQLIDYRNIYNVNNLDDLDGLDQGGTRWNAPYELTHITRDDAPGLVWYVLGLVMNIGAGAGVRAC